MRKSLIKPYQLYAVTRADRTVIPSLALDHGLWDRLPQRNRIVYRPAPKNAAWASVLDRDTGARRGILVLLPKPGMTDIEAMVEDLEYLAREAETVAPNGGAAAISALEGLITDSFFFDAIRDAKVLMSWDDHVSGDNLHRCPKCHALVPLNAASRLRAHENDGTGRPCIQSNGSLSPDKKKK